MVTIVLSAVGAVAVGFMFVLALGLAKAAGREPVYSDACTGLAASWCPVHGDCSCPRDESGEVVWHYEGGYVSVGGVACWTETAVSVCDHDPNCPLHGPLSAHGDDLR